MRKNIIFTLLIIILLSFIACDGASPNVDSTTQKDYHTKTEIPTTTYQNDNISNENKDDVIDKTNIIKEQFIEHIKNNNKKANVEVLNSLILDSVIVYGNEDIVNPPKLDERYMTYYLYYEDGKILLDDVILILGPITDDDNPITYINENEEKIKYQYEQNATFYIFLQSKYGDYHYGIPMSSINDYILTHGGDNLFRIYIQEGKIISAFTRNVP